nr:reverse transcriptase domain-containing protein [Tanacetum cinerariifolium]
APIPLRVHLAAVFELEAMEEAHWGAFYQRNSMEPAERIMQRDDAIANIQIVGNHHNIQTDVAYLREIQLGDIGKLDWFRAIVVESDHRLRCKRWYITKNTKRKAGHRRGRRSGHSRNMSGSPEGTCVFSRIRRDRSESPRHIPRGKGIRDEGVVNRLGSKGKSVPHAQKAVTRVTTQEEWNPFQKIKVAILSEYQKQTIAIGSTLGGRTEGVVQIAQAQKKTSQAPERNKAIQEEVEKLVDIGIMKEVHYHSWLSNPVMVKKHDDSWRMCVDFKDLNKACPKDGYLLPKIDWKVESLCGYPFKCFLDAYKGYHQIKIGKKDEEKTTFITRGAYCLPYDSKGSRECSYDEGKRGKANANLFYFILERPEDNPLDTPMEAEEELLDPWTLFTDGSSCVDGFEAGLIPEYEALIVGLRIAEQMGIKNLQANVDSRLVVNQVNGSSITKEIGMIQYLEKVKTIASNFKKFSITVEELNENSKNEAKVLAVVEKEGETWMTPIYNYLTEETLLAKKEKARAVRRKSRRMHAGIRSVVAKAIQTGYYWPTMHADARKMMRECQDCQCFASVKHSQANGLVKNANRSLGEGIKARIDERSKDWIEEIPHVLWAHRTMIKSRNRDTPFSLTYGTKAIIPAKIGMPTLRTAELDMVQNDEALEINLDLLEERREQAVIHKARSKSKMEILQL